MSVAQESLGKLLESRFGRDRAATGFFRAARDYNDGRKESRAATWRCLTTGHI